MMFTFVFYIELSAGRLHYFHRTAEDDTKILLELYSYLFEEEKTKFRTPPEVVMTTKCFQITKTNKDEE